MKKEMLKKHIIPVFLGTFLIIMGTGCVTGPIQGNPKNKAPSDEPLFRTSDLGNSDNTLQSEMARISYPDGWRALPCNNRDSSTAVLNLVNEESSLSVRIDRLTFPFPVSFERFTELLSSRLEDATTFIGHSETGPAAIIEETNRILVIQEIGDQIWIAEALSKENYIDDRDRNALFQVAASIVPDSAPLTYRQIGKRLTVVLLPPWEWAGDTVGGFIVSVYDEQQSSMSQVEIRITSTDDSRVIEDSKAVSQLEHSPFFTIAYPSVPDQNGQIIELSNGVDTIELHTVSNYGFPGEKWLNLLFSGIVFTGIVQ